VRARGTCRIRFHEYEYRDNTELHFSVFDTKNRQVRADKVTVLFGGTVRILRKSLPLDYDIVVQTHEDTGKKLTNELNTVIKFGPKMQVDFAQRDKSKMPYCNIGKWDELSLLQWNLGNNIPIVSITR
jgi:hypothetical protein